MSNLRGFKQKRSTVSRLWEEQDYEAALAEGLTSRYRPRAGSSCFSEVSACSLTRLL